MNFYWLYLVGIFVAALVGFWKSDLKIKSFWRKYWMPLAVSALVGVAALIGFKLSQVKPYEVFAVIGYIAGGYMVVVWLLKAQKDA